MSVKTKSKPPSRIRYEQKTAVVSARIPKEQKEMLDTFLKVKKYSSFAEWLKDFLVKGNSRDSGSIQDVQDIYMQGYKDGLKDGIIKFISQEFLCINNRFQTIDKTMAALVFEILRLPIGRKDFDKQYWTELVEFYLENDEWVKNWIDKQVKSRSV